MPGGRTRTSSATSSSSRRHDSTRADGVQSIDARGGGGLDAVPGAAAHADRHHRHSEPPADPAAADDPGRAAGRASDIVARFALARMRFVGAPLGAPGGGADRGDLPGSTGASRRGEVVTPSSRPRTIELGYTSPPGVVERTPTTRPIASQRRWGARSTRSRCASSPATCSTASAPRRTSASRPARRTFSIPRAAGLDARARRPGWERGDLQAFIKVGSDDRNFYMYRAPAQHHARWEPEMVVDLDVWRRPPGRRSRALARGALPPSGAAECGRRPDWPTWPARAATSSTWPNPGVNPPNLAAAQELSAGI